MKILIVGCVGQVGQELQHRAPNTWDVLAVDRSKLDITCIEQVKSVVESFTPDVIINAAAYTAVDRAENEREKAYQINCDGVTHLAKVAHACGSKLLHISTDYVFKGDRDTLETYSEKDKTGPTGVYGASKLAGEIAVADACPQHIILRTAWVFGEYGANFVKTMVRLAKDKTEINVVSDQFGGPTYAGDIAEALLLIAKKVCQEDFSQWGIYHFTGLPYTNWAEFASVIVQQAHAQGEAPHLTKINPIMSCDYPTPAKRPSNSMLNCEKIAEIFGVLPSDWRSALLDITKYAAK